MSNVEVAKISVDDQVSPQYTHFHDTTRENVSIWTNGSELFDEQHCFLLLICIEECYGLKCEMKQRIYQTDLIYLDQEKKMAGF
jgi:hypothetical protein